MKYRIKYYSIEGGAGFFEFPAFTHEEIVKTNSISELQTYIESKKDTWGNYFKKSTKAKKAMFGFDYMSHQGGVKVEIYKAPKIKVI